MMAYDLSLLTGSSLIKTLITSIINDRFPQQGAGSNSSTANPQLAHIYSKNYDQNTNFDKEPGLHQKLIAASNLYLRTFYGQKYFKDHNLMITSVASVQIAIKTYTVWENLDSKVFLLFLFIQ